MKRAARITFAVTWLAMAASHIAGIKIALDIDRELRDNGASSIPTEGES